MTDKAWEDAGRRVAQRLYPGPLYCEHGDDGSCGKRAERHHVDGDTHNNVRSNIRFLCRKHHHAEDGRCQRESYRAANRLARIGRKNAASLANLTAQQRKGVPKSAAQRAAMSIGMRGKSKAPWTPERRAAFSALRRALHTKKESRTWHL